MIFAKATCGLWLIRFPICWPELGRPLSKIKAPQLPRLLQPGNPATSRSRKAKRSFRDADVMKDVSLHPLPPSSESNLYHVDGSDASDPTTANPVAAYGSNDMQTSRAKKPLSLYPASILGIAMVARGEIGFLISSTAQSQGLFSRVTAEGVLNDDIFLVVTWAILLCTVVGPLGVGLLVRRVKRLEKDRAAVRLSPLGVWGVEPMG